MAELDPTKVPKPPNKAVKAPKPEKPPKTPGKKPASGPPAPFNAGAM